MIAEREKVDRQKTCPFFLRLLWKENGSRELKEYSEEVVYGHPEEFHLYTWLDASLRELLNVIKTIIPAANRKDARVVFYHVYQDTSGRFKRKELGTVQALKRGQDDNLSLKNGLFEPGDMLDIDIQTSFPQRRNHN